MSGLMTRKQGRTKIRVQRSIRDQRSFAIIVASSLSYLQKSMRFFSDIIDVCNGHKNAFKRVEHLK